MTAGQRIVFCWRSHAAARAAITNPGISPTTATWAQSEGFTGSPLLRGRRTVIALNRREPTQHSEETYERQYTLVDKRVQHEAVEVIAAGAEDALGRANNAVLVADLRDTPDPGDVETATADCADPNSSPFSDSSENGCTASFLMCPACPNAHVHPRTPQSARPPARSINLSCRRRVRRARLHGPHGWRRRQ